jgi:Kef-type K+ transport system membrane component KefB
MTLIGSLCLLLVCAHALGWLAERLGQPSLLGQMVAGILVGPSVLDWLKPGGPLTTIADLSVLFVVITSGLEMRMQHVLDVFRGRGIFALLLGLLVPAAATTVFTYAVGLAFVPAAVVVLCTSVTALPVALRILSTFGLINTRVARVTIASSLLTDVIVVLLLGILIAVASQNAGATLSVTVGVALAKLALLLVIVAACYYVCSKLSARGPSLTAQSRRSHEDHVLTCAVIFMVGLGVVSERLGSHFIIGVFLASLLITGDLVSDARFRKLVETCELMTVSLFGPVFLAYQGVQFELGALKGTAFWIVLTMIAVVSKLISGYVMARLKRLPRYESYGVAIVMNSRGVMEMVIASIAYRAGLVSQSLFSTLLIMGVIATVITPSMLRYWLKDTSNARVMMTAGESGASAG